MPYFCEVVQYRRSIQLSRTGNPFILMATLFTLSAASKQKCSPTFLPPFTFRACLLLTPTCVRSYSYNLFLRLSSPPSLCMFGERSRDWMTAQRKEEEESLLFKRCGLCWNKGKRCQWRGLGLPPPFGMGHRCFGALLFSPSNSNSPQNPLFREKRYAKKWWVLKRGMRREKKENKCNVCFSPIELHFRQQIAKWKLTHLQHALMYPYSFFPNFKVPASHSYDLGSPFSQQYI